MMRTTWTLAVCSAVTALAGAGIVPVRAAELAEGLSLSGDLRVRHESVRPNATLGGDDVDRARMRLRIGLDAKLDDNWDMGLRLATGGGMTSTNQTFDALNEEKAPLHVDRAFARFRAGDARKVELSAGRTPNPYVSSFVLWDTDYNPDGLVEKFVFPAGSGTIFVNAGQHVLGLVDKEYGPGLLGFQSGVELKLGEGKLTAAAACYSFPNADEAPTAMSSVPPGSRYALADLYLQWKGKVLSSGLPLCVWLDTFTNTEAEADRTAVAAGIDVGSAKEKGGVSFSLTCAEVDRDAMWINLGDSTVADKLEDRDLRAFVLKVCAGLGKGATLGATWYSKDDRYSDAHEDKLEVDLVLKF
jgi:hypothetical protein